MDLLVFFDFFFFVNDTATTEIYTLSLHDALPIYYQRSADFNRFAVAAGASAIATAKDRKSGSAGMPRPISYAVFCLKKIKRTRVTRIAENARRPHWTRVSVPRSSQ